MNVVTGAKSEVLLVQPAFPEERVHLCVGQHKEKALLGNVLVQEKGARGLKVLWQFRASAAPSPFSAFHWMYRMSLSFKPKRVLYLSKRHWRDFMYISWYRSTASSDGASILGTVIGSPTKIKRAQASIKTGQSADDHSIKHQKCDYKHKVWSLTF